MEERGLDGDFEEPVEGAIRKAVEHIKEERRSTKVTVVVVEENFISSECCLFFLFLVTLSFYQIF